MPIFDLYVRGADHCCGLPAGDTWRILGRMTMQRFAAFFILLFILNTVTTVAEETFADRVLVNGNILTVDANDSVAEAIAIRGGRITAVGSNADIEARVGPATDRIDLHGQTATPGLIDTHVHFSYGGLLKLTQMDLSYPIVKSIEDIIKLLAERHTSATPGDWILGRGWDEGKLAERRYRPGVRP